ncbi:phosphate-starvation-inducible protein PsiE [Kaarinaea lacus]
MSDIGKKLEAIGDAMIDGFHVLALLVIGMTIIWSAVNEYLDIMHRGTADLKDILLLFIYLELGAMVGIYFKTKKLPVIFLIYIAITALTRVLTVDVKTMDNWRMFTVTGSIVLLTLAGAIISIGKPRWLRKERQIIDSN